MNTSCYGLHLSRWLRRAPGPGRLDLDDFKDGHLSREKRAELEAAIAAAGLKVKKRCYYKHLFQPMTTLLVRLTHPGSGARAAKEKALNSGLLRALNAVRIFVAGLDALFFGWFPGGAVIYKLEK